MTLTAEEALDMYFLDMRSRALELAATLDRIGRGIGFDRVRADERLAKLQDAFKVLTSDEPGRAERVQLVFSAPVK